jgi:hypothetical protein|tara:strand:- start:7342 stop:7758 length:417 start_codon:yes stop_codon:yes gene_type:complete
MPRKKVESEVAEPVAAAPATETVGGVSYSGLTVERGALPDDADMNGDGHISKREMEMHLEFKRKELEDQDAMRDAQRKMAWFALIGMLLYPFAVVIAVLLNLDQAATVLGSMAATYFVSVAAIVMAFFGAQAYSGKSK